MVTAPLLLTVPLPNGTLQVTCVVMSWLVPSEYVPVAVACALHGKAQLLGQETDTVIPVSAGPCPVRVVNPDTIPEVAVIFVAPAAATPVAMPLLLFTVATEVLDEIQVTCVVISWVVASE